LDHNSRTTAGSVIVLAPQDLIKLIDFATLPAAILLLATWATYDLYYVVFLISGLVIWTLAEYWLHRAFHDWLFKRAHIRHHQSPVELSEGVLYSSTVTMLLLVYCWFDRSAIPIAQGLLAGYLLYITIHVGNHRWPIVRRILPQLMENHDLHHRGPPGRRFGVTTGLWDRVFSTR
jgi:sterol desaturase/sphingolipid hydroxylase (fatty acid hydroxylase superfamily)